MSKIQFAEGLSFDVDAATQAFGIIARRGAGKSYAAGKLIEGLAENEVQFVVLDPVGNFWGLRLAADGKKPGIDVPVLGGLRGDIPLSPDSGKLMADTVVETGRSFVLDVSQFSLGERKRFLTAFGEQLWQRQKGLHDPRPIHVVLEECQLFLPQQPMPDERHMLGIWTEIVRLGRNKGIGVSLISQRPQSVAKEALTQVECLIVLQVNGVSEKKALKEWIVEKGLDTNLLEELPFLAQGVAYIWSPQWLQHFGKHKIEAKWTFDAGATPTVGQKRVKAELKPIDLDALKNQMSETVKKAEENDPAALKKRIRELEMQARKSGIDPSELRALERRHTETLARFEQDMLTQLNAMQQTLTGWKTWKMPAPEQHGVQQVFTLPEGTHPPREHMPRNKVAQQETNGEQRLNKGARAMLRALASRAPTRLTKTQVATLAGLSPSSGTFSTYLSQLRSAGCLVEDAAGGFGISQSGQQTLGESVSQPASTAELVEQWSAKLPGTVTQMLRELVSVFPQTMSKEQLGERVSITPTSGTMSTYLSKLRSNGLVVVDRSTGHLKASEDLFL